MRYLFPRYRKPTNKRSQLEHIQQEAREVAEADSEIHMLEEVLDLIHACETLLRMYPKQSIRMLVRYVTEKNRKRGYYRWR